MANEENKIICPSCGAEVEVTNIKIKDKIMYKYISFSKVVGMCPECTADIHLPEFDEIISGLERINRMYVKAAGKYTNISDISKDTDFSKDWEEIPKEELTFENIDDDSPQVVLSNMLYNGTLLKSDIGYDVVTIESEFEEKINEIKKSILGENDEEEPTTETVDVPPYNFKTYVYLNDTYKQICCTMWKDITGNVSGLLYNTDDTTSYRYAKQKSKNKEVIV